MMSHLSGKRTLVGLCLFILACLVVFFDVSSSKKLKCFLHEETTTSGDDTRSTVNHRHNNSSAYAAERDQHAEAAVDTAIIISSSWVPSHPNLTLIENAMQSVDKHVKGLSKLVPIFIMVDGLSEYEESKHQQLDEYVQNLYHTYGFPTNRNHKHQNETGNTGFTNIHIFVNIAKHHLGGMIQRMLNLMDQHFPHIKYLYSLQHDLVFCNDINHTAIVQTVEEYPLNSINMIRFMLHDYNLSKVQCHHEANDKDITNGTSLVPSEVVAHGIKLWHSMTYSDQNHFVTRDYYRKMIDGLFMVNRFPEAPMMNRAGTNCRVDGQWLYGTVQDGYLAHAIEHLHGRTISNPQSIHHCHHYARLL